MDDVQNGSTRLLVVIGGIFVFLILLIVFSTNMDQQNPPLPTPFNYRSKIDPIFMTYYDYLGGEAVLGEVISAVVKEGHTTVQYTSAVKLVFDPQETADRLFHLAPLGRQLEIEEEPVSRPESPGQRYDGHNIYPDFWPLYEKLGARTVGKALTEMHYNPTLKRYEQYFENLGFYRLEGSTEVRLLAYGVWACGKDCIGTASIGNAEITLYPYVDEIFRKQVDWLGFELTGFALSEPYVNQSGDWEQIFENVVLVTNTTGKKGKVRLRPVLKELSYPADAPKVTSGDPGIHFYAVEGNKGFDIPDFFWAYIVKHGGLKVIGLPMTHYKMVKPRVYCQCFTNLCLNHVPDEVESLRIRPEPLGYAYQLLNRAVVSAGVTQTPTERVTTIKVWESYPSVSPHQQQEIGIMLLSNFEPLVGIEAELLLFLPDGILKTQIFPPTDEKGRSSLTIPKIQASNGTMVKYYACVQRMSGDKFCEGETFVIWNVP